MRRSGLLALIAALFAAASPPVSLAGSAAGEVEIEAPAGASSDDGGGYRPRWADPNAKPPMPGIENDPTPFNPADVDANSDTLDNNLNDMGQ